MKGERASKNTLLGQFRDVGNNTLFLFGTLLVIKFTRETGRNELTTELLTTAKRLTNSYSLTVRIRNPMECMYVGFALMWATVDDLVLQMPAELISKQTCVSEISSVLEKRTRTGHLNLLFSAL